MNKTILLGAATAIVAVGALATGYFAGRPSQPAAVQEAAPGVAGEELERGRIEEIVRNYLITNPEVMLEVQTALEEKQREEQRLAQVGVIEDAMADIFNADYDGVVGNPDGKVTVVEFYDYNCGYCKRALADMQAMTAQDPDLRFVLKEFPILGADSQKAHMVSMAFHRIAPEKYGEFHVRLLSSQGRADEASAIRIAVELGADEAKLREEMRKPAINEAFSKTFELAEKLSITGTPSYVVGQEVVFGALGQELLTEKVAAARAVCAERATC